MDALKAWRIGENRHDSLPVDGAIAWEIVLVDDAVVVVKVAVDNIWADFLDELLFPHDGKPDVLPDAWHARLPRKFIAVFRQVAMPCIIADANPLGVKMLGGFKEIG